MLCIFSAQFHTYHITTGDWDAVWIDGRDIQEEGVWKLSSGEPISETLQWNPGQNYMKHGFIKLKFCLLTTN